MERPGPQIALQGLRASPEQLGGLQATGLQKDLNVT